MDDATEACATQDGPTLTLRMVETATGHVHEVEGVPAKLLLGGALHVLVVAADWTSTGAEVALKRLQDEAAAVNTHIVAVLVERMEDVAMYRLEVPLPNADDPAAVDWFAERCALEYGVNRLAYPAARDALQNSARGFLRALADWPGAKGGEPA